jgi:hypothetical protein
VAGGLGSDCVERLVPLLEAWQVSWDAEGRLMNDAGLIPELVSAYLQASRRLLSP